MSVNDNGTLLVNALWTRKFETGQFDRILRLSTIVAVGVGILFAGGWTVVPTPTIPTSLQAVASVFIGGALGWRLGSLTFIIYISFSFLGLPLFIAEETFLTLNKLTYGYAIGVGVTILLSALFAARGWYRHLGLGILAANMSVLATLLTGMFFLSFNQGIVDAFRLGFLPYIFNNVIKGIVVAIILWGCWKCVDYLKSKKKAAE
ncbi:biotin transporter BioY [Sneathiella aquimaris]|uniref:biotin transporter BioY n=1 Tax=Sneathiella aquimaris TaxID=2599305 RepID=UPI00146D6266|nr:biotin transporter BioY [Sneathiella aquimaris]